MVQSDFRTYLPPSTELPDSDDIPVDNEDQNLIPNVLLFLLNFIWTQRQDWYFGVDMGIYHSTEVHPRVPVVPDGFLSLGVERRKDGQSRRSYVTWEENDIVPKLVLEVVSWTPGGEYIEKLETYSKLRVLYYLVYNPNHWQRDGHQPFELYKLVDDTYQLQLGEPFWMPEISLAIGRYQGTVGGIQQELLGWFDAQGKRYLTPEEKAERLAARLRELGEDPDQL
ncbi:MAG: Uma2 family endonuclease [Cyanobacteria bacterium P01_F01_bin.116]